MTREELIQAAKAKYAREQLVAQAKAKYASEQGQSQAPTVQEMPEWLSASDRAIAKNFSNSDEKQVEFLKKQYPGADVKLVNGQVVLKQPSEKEYRTLDPETGFFSKDFLHDVGDIGYDLASGVAESAATAAGAVGGFIGGGGFGALPGAMAASGATSAGSEALRQKLGQYLGIPQEVDMTDVAISGGTGLASPLIFGAGSAGKNGAKMLAKKGLTTEAFDKASSGLVGRGLKAAGSALSGVPQDVMDYYKKNYNRIDKLDDAGVTEVAKDTYDQVKKYIETTKKGAVGEINQALSEAGQGIDVSGAKKAFTNRINELKSKTERSKADKAEIVALESAFEKYFGLDQAVLPDESKVLQDPQMKQLFSALDDKMGNSKNYSPGNISDPIKSSLPKPATTYEPSHDSFLKDLTKFTSEASDQGADFLQSEADELAQAYASKNQSEIQRVIREISNRRNKVMAENARHEVLDTLPADRAFDLQKRLSQLAKWEQNMTPETAAMKGSARDSYGAINKSMDAATEGLSSDSKGKYQAVRQFEDYITPKIEGNTDADSYQKTLGFMTGMDKDSKTVMRDMLSRMADSGKLDISDNLDLMRSYSKLGGKTKASIPLRQIPAATVGAGLGYYAGAQSGMGQGGAGVGAAAGGLLAGGAASRTAVKNILKGSLLLDKLPSAPMAAPVANKIAPWMFNFNTEDNK